MVKTVISPKDMALAEQYAYEGCQNGTICGLMDWDHEWLVQRKDTLRKLTKKRQQRKLSLRQAQNSKAYTQAEDGKVEGKDTTMLIFLGKNDLGQSDVIKTEHNLGARTIADIFALVSAKRASLPNPVKHIESEVVDV